MAASTPFRTRPGLALLALVLVLTRAVEARPFPEPRSPPYQLDVSALAQNPDTHEVHAWSLIRDGTPSRVDVAFPLQLPEQSELVLSYLAPETEDSCVSLRYTAVYENGKQRSVVLLRAAQERIQLELPGLFGRVTQLYFDVFLRDCLTTCLDQCQFGRASMVLSLQLLPRWYAVPGYHVPRPQRLPRLPTVEHAVRRTVLDASSDVPVVFMDELMFDWNSRVLADHYRNVSAAGAVAELDDNDDAFDAAPIQSSVYTQGYVHTAYHVDARRPGECLQRPHMKDLRHPYHGYLPKDAVNQGMVPELVVLGDTPRGNCTLWYSPQHKQGSCVDRAGRLVFVAAYDQQGKLTRHQRFSYPAAAEMHPSKLQLPGACLAPCWQCGYGLLPNMYAACDANDPSSCRCSLPRVVSGDQCLHTTQLCDQDCIDNPYVCRCDADVTHARPVVAQTCTSAFHGGVACDQPICDAPCQGNVLCGFDDPKTLHALPGRLHNVTASCKTCAPGWSGSECQDSMCGEGCPGLRVCVDRGKCACPPMLEGSACQHTAKHVPEHVVRDPAGNKAHTPDYDLDITGVLLPQDGIEYHVVRIDEPVLSIALNSACDETSGNCATLVAMTRAPRLPVANDLAHQRAFGSSFSMLDSGKVFYVAVRAMSHTPEQRHALTHGRTHPATPQRYHLKLSVRSCYTAKKNAHEVDWCNVEVGHQDVYIVIGGAAGLLLFVAAIFQFSNYVKRRDEEGRSILSSSAYSYQPVPSAQVS